jgi:hypothetical protein
MYLASQLPGNPPNRTTVPLDTLKKAFARSIKSVQADVRRGAISQQMGEDISTVLLSLLADALLDSYFQDVDHVRLLGHKLGLLERKLLEIEEMLYQERNNLADIMET